jgi:hypothetical protein
MAAHGCVGNPCWICFPEYAPKGTYMPFPSVKEKEDWTMRYKDIDSDEAPWITWKSTDKPSDLFIDALKNEGFHRLEVMNA